MSDEQLAYQTIPCGLETSSVQRHRLRSPWVALPLAPRCDIAGLAAYRRWTDFLDYRPDAYQLGG